MARRYRKKAAKKEPDDKAPGEYTAPIDFGHIADRHKREPSIGAFLTPSQRKVIAAMNKDPYEHDIRCGYAGCIDQTQHSLEQLIKCVSLDGRTALEAVQIWNGKVPDRYRVPPDASRSLPLPIEGRPPPIPCRQSHPVRLPFHVSLGPRSFWGSVVVEDRYPAVPIGIPSS